MEIRFLNADDAGEWSRLRLEALEQDPSAFSSSVEEHHALPLAEVQRRLTGNGDSFVVGAFEDGRLIGMAGFHRETGPKTRHKGRVWGVYVTAAKRGQGAARRIMRTLLDRAASTPGIEQILLSVTDAQSVALSLYRSLGFVIFGTEPRALKVDGRVLDEHYFVLTLHGEGIHA